ncbi:hypothetical protein DID88_002058 [Monilinia fructigena]|uniref:Malic enzyme n=1 Tax=Monilinia fructigena TaxID=38457 RepID=A0A395IV33_9HELO|nr:hypothetical protein DID88_002058 [Monilinia fructigena]
MKQSSLDHLKGYNQSHYGTVEQSEETEYISEDSAKGYQVLRTSFTPEERVNKNLTGLIPHVLESLDTQCIRAMRMINSRPEALYISIKQRKSIKTILKNWPYKDPSICVVTDGSRILGLGDLGVNGVGIPIGKLSLYTGAAGIHPEKTLPIVWTAKRPTPEVEQEFMDEFIAAVKEVYPEMLVQFEDSRIFESGKAFKYLERYKEEKMFNDDIQGTGAVVLAGYIGAVNLSGVPIEDQKIVMEYYTRRGLSEQAARDKFWLVDTKGLVTNDRGDRLAEHKKIFARTDNNGHQFATLEEVIEYVKPTALIGLTATFGVFTESVVRALKVSVEAGAITWTEGTVIFASGSPFSPFTIKHSDSSDSATTYYPNQGNNVYIFPGLGLGAILAKATRVTDAMVYQSAEALSGCFEQGRIVDGTHLPQNPESPRCQRGRCTGSHEGGEKRRRQCAE